MAQSLARPSFVVKQQDKKVRIEFSGLEHSVEVRNWKNDKNLDINVALPKWWKGLPKDVRDGATAKFEGTKEKVPAKGVIEKGGFDPKYLDLSPEPWNVEVRTNSPE
jgi:hypothetical protein